MPWYRFIWNRLTIPKHRFTLWLALLDRLKTRAMLFRIGIADSNTCAICGNGFETSTHLFFECKFSKEFLQLVMQWLGFHQTRDNMFQMLQWVGRHCKKGFRCRVVIAALAGLVYQVWRPRNTVGWDLHGPSKQSVVQNVQFNTKHRIQNQICKKTSIVDQEWFNSL